MTVDGSPVTLTGAPTVSGTFVTLTLGHGGDGRPDGDGGLRPILSAGGRRRTSVQDLAGNDAATFGAQPVANILKSTDASLSALSLSGVTLTPAFHPDSLNYTGSAPHSVATTTVSATKNHASAAIQYLDGSGQALVDADANTPGLQVALEVGTDTIKVKLTAEDGVTTRTYTAIVTRHELPATGVTLSVSPDEVGEGDGSDGADRHRHAERRGVHGGQDGGPVGEPGDGVGVGLHGGRGDADDRGGPDDRDGDAVA